ncbi:MAG: hypothetical protein HXY21_02100 [Parvularculaceae bacterium]|nr:hypothetical protein [Parvularculaceae bacterium]
MKFAVCALGALAAAQGSALAQNMQLTPAGAVIQKISSNDLITILQSAQLGARLIDDAADGTKTIEVSSGGDFVYMAMRGCEGAGGASPCELVQPYGFFNAQGVTLDQVNNFNMNVSGIATAALLPDRGVMATKIYLNGGVTPSNLIYELSVYFSDITRLLEALKPGAIAQVSYTADDLGRPNAGVELGSFNGPETPHVNAIGGARAGLMTEAVKAVLVGRGKTLN